MSIQARLEIFATNSRRAAPRRKLQLGSTLSEGGHDVVIHDLSATGVLLQTSARLEPFDDLEVDLPEIGATSAFVDLELAVVATTSDRDDTNNQQPRPQP